MASDSIINFELEKCFSSGKYKIYTNKLRKNEVQISESFNKFSGTELLFKVMVGRVKLIKSLSYEKPDTYIETVLEKGHEFVKLRNGEKYRFVNLGVDAELLIVELK